MTFKLLWEAEQWGRDVVANFSAHDGGWNGTFSSIQDQFSRVSHTLPICPNNQTLFIGGWAEERGGEFEIDKSGSLIWRVQSYFSVENFSAITSQCISKLPTAFDFPQHPTHQKTRIQLNSSRLPLSPKLLPRNACLRRILHTSLYHQANLWVK